MGQVITVINMKGGVGKTTLTMNLAYTLAKEKNKKILIIDSDPQMSATTYFYKDDEEIENKVIKNKEETIYKIYDQFEKVEKSKIIKKFTDNLHYIPSHLEFDMSSSLRDLDLLKKFIRDDNNNLTKEYDYIFIDTPPTFSSYSKSALLASDGYVIPTTCNRLSLCGIEILHRKLEAIKDLLKNANFKLYGIIITKSPAKNTIKYDRTMNWFIQKPIKDNNYEKYLYKSSISDQGTAADGILFNPNPKMRFFIENGKKNNDSNGAKRLNVDIRSLTDEFLNRTTQLS